ncbi:MAG: hypothetical protein ACK4GK_15965 [Ferrovibrio sp.]|jgi:hypothetical protein
MKTPAVPLFAAVLLSGCVASTEWSRSDTSLQQRLADEKDCAEIAYWQALDESFASGPKYPPYRDTQFIYSGDDDGGGITTSYSRRGAREYELTEYCMRQRGYVLVPIARP